MYIYIYTLLVSFHSMVLPCRLTWNPWKTIFLYNPRGFWDVTLPGGYTFRHLVAKQPRGGLRKKRWRSLGRQVVGNPARRVCSLDHFEST